MFQTTLVRAAGARTPLIRFPDRRAPREPHAPHAHPAAPPEVVATYEQFQDFRASGPHFDPEKLQPSGGTGAAAGAVADLHELPERFWNTRSLRWSAEEMDAVMSGGAPP
ncbi:hypothetical protein MSPP1_002791 [Malassezia sp. CBS 17886]|nr:hypothetical protein MSPP1_002791 [Malassezia sp. CBS 17886]